MKDYNKLFTKLTKSFNETIESSSKIISEINAEIDSNFTEIERLKIRNEEISSSKQNFDKLITGIDKLIGND